MWELDCRESWEPKNWCFWTVLLEKTLESPLDCKEIQLVHPKGSQPWIFIGRTDAEAETPILWPPDVKNWLIKKDPDAGKDWRQEEKGTTEDEMVGWHRGLNGHEFEQAPGVGDRQGSLACCNPWGYKESDRTEQLNWNWIHIPILFQILFLYRLYRVLSWVSCAMELVLLDIYFLYVLVVQSLSHVWLFVTPRTEAHHVSLSFIVSQSLLKLMSIESVLPSNQLILFCPLLLPSVFPHQGLFQWVDSSH